MTDVLIIGSGAAGLSAALNAKENTSNVTLISKTFPTHSQTVQAQGGINAVLYEEDDSVEQHIKDTYLASKEIANKDAISIMCKEAKDTIFWLDKKGVPFNRNDKEQIAQRKFGGTSKIRTCYSSDYTGLKIVHTLYDQCIKNDINIINEHYLLDLIVEDNVCKGAVFLDILSSEVKQINAKTVILATGGYAGIYSNKTTNSYSNSADGVAIALRAGAKLSNMEFVQFHPTTLLNSNILISESARGEGGFLVTEDENRFINELEARDKVARAIYTKNNSNEQVYLDLRHLGLEKINELMPQERKLALEFSGVKLEEQLLPITPSAHYSMGGVLTDKTSQTSIKNLYACGECAQANIHGANRLGGNSLLEIVTFGKIAGISASNKAKEIISSDEEFDIKTKYEEYIDSLLENENCINFYNEKDKLGLELFNKVGLYRDDKNLNEALKTIHQIDDIFNQFGLDDKSRTYNKNLIELLEFKNIVEVSKIVIMCAIQRKESRGSHYRTDYENTSDEYKKASMIKIEEGVYNIYFEDMSC